MTVYFQALMRLRRLCAGRLGMAKFEVSGETLRRGRDRKLAVFVVSLWARRLRPSHYSIVKVGLRMAKRSRPETRHHKHDFAVATVRGRRR